MALPGAFKYFYWLMAWTLEMLSFERCRHAWCLRYCIWKATVWLLLEFSSMTALLYIISLSWIILICLPLSTRIQIKNDECFSLLQFTGNTYKNDIGIRSCLPCHPSCRNGCSDPFPNTCNSWEKYRNYLDEAAKNVSSLNILRLNRECAIFFVLLVMLVGCQLSQLVENSHV